MLLFFFHAGTENEDRTDLRSVLLPSGDLKGTYFPSLYVYAYFIVAKWSVILFFRFFFFFLFFSFVYYSAPNNVAFPKMASLSKTVPPRVINQFSRASFPWWLTNSSSRDSDAGSRLSSQDDSHCYGQQSFIGLNLRIASLLFRLFFFEGGGGFRLQVGYIGLWSSDCLFVDLLFPRSN